jgi:hypothetical protein
VLFAIDIASREVEGVGVAVNPGGAWMEQIARNLVDAVDGFLLGRRYVLTVETITQFRGSAIALSAAAFPPKDSISLLLRRDVDRAQRGR